MYPIEIIALLEYTNQMKIELKKAPKECKELLHNLMNLYLYDFSEFDKNMDVDEHGIFGYKYFDLYWIEGDRYPFIIYVNGLIAGFALVNKHTYTGKADHRIAEFFVMRKYRNKGIGRTVAYQLFDKFSGWWEVVQTKENIAAKEFWSKIISTYTGNNFEDYQKGLGKWEGSLQLFESKTST